MKVCVILEQRYRRTPNGAVWGDPACSHLFSFWSRYLTTFDGVRVVARVEDVPSVPSDWRRADGENVSFFPIPYYIGPYQYLRVAHQVKKAAQGAIAGEHAVVLRLWSQIAATVVPLLCKTGHPYGVEVIGDPSDVFAPGAIHHPLRPFFRWLNSRRLRLQCAGACSVAYVTKNTLQQRYPPVLNAFTTNYSSIELPTSAIVDRPRPINRADNREFCVVTVGSLEHFHKGTDVLIDALGECVRHGLNLRLVVLGDGKYRAGLESRANVAGLGNRVVFLGRVSGCANVRAELDKADLFVLPSRTEGLPRAMIEAMARALPCIGSTAGGIPELLPAEDMVPPGDAPLLSRKIREMITSPQRMAHASARNLDKAQQYREEVLQQRRVAFYRYLREITRAWLRQSN
ncbi:MAG: glycosyl transferase family 1 [Planctomycetes bacterium B3_Pla]|nr:MAG: glycosyl transferase family 1 [Planctomycetes bacterium B3_Pla]